MNENEMDDEISLVEIFQILWGRRKLLLSLLVLFGSLSLAYAMFAPWTYRAECRILPPSQNSSRAAGLLAQMGGLADLVGLPGTATSGQLMIAILQSDPVVDAIIDRFSLMELYEADYRLKMRESVVKNILETDEDVKSGIVSVAVLDEEPGRAAEMANAFVEELQKQMQGLSLTEAANRRAFFETQLQQSQQALGEAEDAMLRYQQSSGVVVPGVQTEALLVSITTLQRQIAAKNVEISALSTHAKRDNPRLKVAQSQLAAMNRELQRLEAEKQKTDSGRLASGDAFSSISQAPEREMEFQRYARDLRFATAMYEMMLRQVESAKLDEAKDFSTIQIVSPATPPDYKYKPKRAQIVIIGTMLGLCLGIFWVFVSRFIADVKRSA